MEIVFQSQKGGAMTLLKSILAFFGQILKEMGKAQKEMQEFDAEFMLKLEDDENDPKYFSAFEQKRKIL